MATEQDTTAAKDRIDALRDAITDERLKQDQELVQASTDVEHDVLLVEEERLMRELAILRGDPIETPTVTSATGDYVVPLGTVEVDTDVLVVENPLAPVNPSSFKKNELIEKASIFGVPVNPGDTKAIIADNINETLASGEAPQEV